MRRTPKNSMTDVLIADRGGKIGEAVVRSLRGHGLSVEVFDERQWTNDYPAYIRNLKRAVQQCQPRMIMPVFKAEWVARHRAEFPTLIPVSDAAVLEELDDKVQCSALAKSLGIDQPRLYSDDSLDQIGSWPVVYKRSTGLSGSSIYFPKTRSALDNLIRSSAKPHLVMDYIDGYDLSVDLIRWPMVDGSIFRRAAAYRVLWPRGKGISYIRIGVDRPDLISAAEKILDAVDYRGVCGVDFRVDDRTGQAFFLECNPRFSGGIRSSLAAGLDLPFLLWQLAGGAVPATPGLKRHRISIG